MLCQKSTPGSCVLLLYSIILLLLYSIILFYLYYISINDMCKISSVINCRYNGCRSYKIRVFRYDKKFAKIIVSLECNDTV